MFNKNILNYCFKGRPFGKDRRAITSIKSVLIDQNVHAAMSFDSEGYYFITILGDKYYIDVHAGHNGRIEISPEEYLCILTGESDSLNWYENLQVGDQVKIIYCDKAKNSYHFVFGTYLVCENLGKYFTISDVCTTSPPIQYPRWFNGDKRAYYIKDLDLWLPSSIFVPIFDKRNPVISIELKEISFLKNLDLL